MHHLIQLIKKNLISLIILKKISRCKGNLEFHMLKIVVFKFMKDKILWHFEINYFKYYYIFSSYRQKLLVSRKSFIIIKFS